jgi:hypothetical protein
MRFMTLYRPDKLALPEPQKMAEMGRLIDELTKAGILLTTDGLQPGGKSAKVRLSEGKFTVTDGPFTEAKEVIGGFAVLKVKSLEELYAVSRRFLEIAGDGESEIHEMFDPNP